MKEELTVALAGNPNAGKSTIFNNLTGTRQHVGNYPGVTVERKEGHCRHGNAAIKIIDLPGTYSLTAYSAEEVVARDVIIEDRPDIVVDIIDASNLERNLYLAVQIMELGAPLVLAFNMSDIARAKGYQFDLEKLSRFFGVPIVETVGYRGKGMDELLAAITATAGADKKPKQTRINYGRELEEEISAIEEALVRAEGALTRKYDLRWLAIKLLEKDKDIFSKIKSGAIMAQVKKSSSRIEEILGETPETAIAGARYGFISGACQEAVRSTIELRHTLSDRIDAVVTNRVMALPIFLVLMYLVFQLTFTLGGPPMDWIGGFFGWLGGAVGGLWPAGAESFLKSLIVDGIINGVGVVITFLPNILFLFLAIAVLEDSGYMARAAFIMDRIMHSIGLHGKSFIPMLIGFGCSIPAIMATRTIENRRDRLTTMLVIPLMSCGARLPIYALIIPAFFPKTWQAPMLWLIYMIGIALAVLSAKLLRLTLLKGESIAFVMELPPYRMPTFKGVLLHMWERGRLYLKKAGTVILGMSILLWAMSSFPGLPNKEKAHFDNARNVILAGSEDEEKKVADLAAINNKESEVALNYTLAGRIGHAMEPVLAPMGFDWKIGTAMIGAFAAKEVFVSQLAIVNSVGEADSTQSLRDKLKKAYTPLVAFCIMLFSLISAPCMATIAVTRRESNSWKWAFLQLGGLTAMAYVITVLVYQTGRFFSIGI